MTIQKSKYIHILIEREMFDEQIKKKTRYNFQTPRKCLKRFIKS